MWRRLTLIFHSLRSSPLAPPDVIRILSLPHRLRVIDLTGGYRYVDDSVLLAIASSPASATLEALRLDHCEKITEAGGAALAAARLSALTTLSTRAVTGIDFKALMRTLPSLTDLDVAWCRQLTEGDFETGEATGAGGGPEAVEPIGPPSLAASLVRINMEVSQLSYVFAR